MRERTSNLAVVLPISELWTRPRVGTIMLVAAAAIGYQTPFRAPPRRRGASRPALLPVASTYQEYLASREAAARAKAMPVPPPESDFAEAQYSAPPVKPAPFVDHDLAAEIKAAAEARMAAQAAEARIAAQEAAAMKAAAEARMAAQAAEARVAAQEAAAIKVAADATMAAQAADARIAAYDAAALRRRGRSAPDIITTGFGNLLKEPLGWCFGRPSALYSNAGESTPPSMQVYFFALVLMMSTIVATIVGSMQISSLEVAQAQKPQAQQAQYTQHPWQYPLQSLIKALTPFDFDTSPSNTELDAGEMDAADAADADAAADTAGVSAE